MQYPFYEIIKDIELLSMLWKGPRLGVMWRRDKAGAAVWRCRRRPIIDAVQPVVDFGQGVLIVATSEIQQP